MVSPSSRQMPGHGNVSGQPQGCSWLLRASLRAGQWLTTGLGQWGLDSQAGSALRGADGGLLFCSVWSTEVGLHKYVLID